MLLIRTDRFEDDNRKNRIENVGQSILEEVLPGPEVEHLRLKQDHVSNSGMGNRSSCDRSMV